MSPASKEVTVGSDAEAGQAAVAKRTLVNKSISQRFHGEGAFVHGQEIAERQSVV